MSERHCKTCGGTGHYAKTCGRRATAATVPTERDIKPENAMHEAAPTTAATREKDRAPTAMPTAEAVAFRKAVRRAARTRKREMAEARWLAEHAEAQRRREEDDAKAYPWNHIRREGRSCGVDACRGCNGYLVRHTWQHDTTGERIVVTVPLTAADHPAPSEAVPLRWDGQIVRRRIKGVESALRSMPSATARVYAADGALTATYRLELVEAAS